MRTQDRSNDEQTAEPAGDLQDVSEPSPERPNAGKKVWLWATMLSVVALGSAYWVRAGDDEMAASGDKKARAPRAVETALVTRGDLPLVAEYRGELDTEVAELASQGSGRLVDVKVNLGDVFKKGDVLATIDASETRRLLSEAQAQVQSASAEKQRATAEFENARAEAERGERLLQEQVISPQELSALKSRVNVFEAQVGAADAGRAAASSRVQLYQEQLRQAELRAPFDGAVAKRYLDVGATVAPGSQVLRLVKGGPLEVRFRASEMHVSRLKTGTPLQITTLGTGERVFAGELLRVSAEVSRTDRSVEVEGQLKEIYAELRPGMYATVRASLGTLEGATLLPSQAMLSKILPDGSSERGVFVTDGENADYKTLEVLGEYEGKAAVRGVEPGVRVVVQGQDLLKDGAAVRLTQEKGK